MRPEISATILPHYAVSVALPRVLPLVALLALFSSSPCSSRFALGWEHLPVDELGGAPGWAVFVSLIGVSLVGGLPVTALALRTVYAFRREKPSYRPPFRAAGRVPNAGALGIRVLRLPRGS